MTPGLARSPRRAFGSAAGLTLCAFLFLALGEKDARGEPLAPEDGAGLEAARPAAAEAEGADQPVANDGLVETRGADLAPATFQNGKASYYHPSLEGRPTANGEPYRSTELTAAHRTLPFGTVVRVVNLTNGRSVVVRINDRGPFVQRRVIDLSKSAARELQMVRQGVAPVKLEILEPTGD